MALDPMAWLESLAARQGAKAEELTTAHNMDIPEPPAGTVIDEPGYVDYDPFSGSGIGKPTGLTGMLGAEQPAAATPSRPTPAPQAAPQPEPEPVSDISGNNGDVLGGLDALSWLDSLQAQQDAEAAALGLDFSETISSTSFETVSGPAQADELPSGGMSPEEAARILGLEAAPAGGSDDALGGLDPLQWLESLAAQQGADVDAILGASEMGSGEGPRAEESTLDWLDSLARGQTGPLDSLTSDLGDLSNLLPDLAAPSPASPIESDEIETSVDLSVGMSNDPNELQNWLLNLGESRPEDIGEGASDEVAAAVPADLPDWLRASMPPADAGGQAVTSQPALDDQILEPVSPSDLPDWLRTSETPAIDLEEDLLKAMSEAGGPTTPAAEPEIQLSQAELDALTKPGSPEQVDSWAEALDEEYDRKLAGDQSVPDWYMEAISRAEAALPRTGTLPSQTPVAPAPEPVAPTVSDAEMPDWLREAAGPESVETEAVAGDIPDWLRTLSPEAPTAPATTPVSQPAAQEELPDWLTAEPEIEPEPEPVKPTPQPAPKAAPAPVAQATPTPVAAAPAQPAPAPSQRPAAPPPQGRTVETMRVRSAGPTGPEHHERLNQARELVASNQYTTSLQHYQYLIDSSQLLEETRGDLRELVEQNPSDPKLRRLLGDTHMRLGDLQAALDTYRSALDQL